VAASPTPTATEIPSRPAVDTNTSARDTVPCAPNSATTCIIAFEFSPIGLPSTATYYVAVRTRNPDGDWLVLPAPANRVEVEIDTSNPAQEYQFAVLVFLADPTFVPEMVELLVDTGADSAFVTAMVAPQR
jgi:hypothetical protein